MSWLRICCLGLCCLIAHPLAADNQPPDASGQVETVGGERFGPPVRGGHKIPAQVGVIAISAGSRVCYLSPETIRLWRTDADQAARLEIKNTSTQQKARLIWPAGQQSLAWPVDKMPVTNGTSYLLSTESFAEVVSLYQIPADLTDQAAQSEWMRQQGCPAGFNEQKS